MRNADVLCARAEMPASTGALHLVVGIPSAGRRDVLSATLRHLACQTRPPDEIVVSVPHLDDIDQECLAHLPCPSRLLISSRGSCHQRNRILDSVSYADVVVFLDDDFLMASNYLEEVEKLFLEHREVAIATGTVIADGATGPGISIEEAKLKLKSSQASMEYDPNPLRGVYCGYGCNMAVRMSAIGEGNVRFDERLPLYGWLEDVDFSRLAARHGRVVRSTLLRGVHLGTKVGRTSGLRFGYSQIANPIYLTRKGTLTARHACVQMARNILANAVKVWRPESWIDRKGRVRGNLRAFADLLSGRLAPHNVETME